MSGNRRTWVRKPDYFDRFRCTASACSDNCCIGWEIDIDEKTAERYKNVTGELGKKLWEMILWPEEEEMQAEGVQGERFQDGGVQAGEISSDREPPHFILQGERCPFLNQDNLCEIIRKLGEDSLCDICREHPRYYEWFEGLTEKGVGLCCEAAAGLILESSKKAEFVLEPEEWQEEEPRRERGLMQESEPRQWDEQLNEPLLTSLLEARAAAFELLQNREILLDERLALYLMFSEDIQDYLSMYADYLETTPQEECEDADDGVRAGVWSGARAEEAVAETAERIRGVADEYRDPEFVSELLKDCRADGGSGTAGHCRTILKFLRTLDPVSEQWPELLGRLEDELTSVLAKREEFSAYFKEQEYQYEHLAVYFTYRYYLKSYFDCDLLSRAVFTVVSILVIRLFDMEKYAAAGCLTVEEQRAIVRYYSRELEYSTDNLRAFSEEVWEGEALTTESLLELLFS